MPFLWRPLLIALWLWRAKTEHSIQLGGITIITLFGIDFLLLYATVVWFIHVIHETLFVGLAFMVIFIFAHVLGLNNFPNWS